MLLIQVVLLFFLEFFAVSERIEYTLLSLEVPEETAIPKVLEFLEVLVAGGSGIFELGLAYFQEMDEQFGVVESNDDTDVMRE